MIRVKYHQELTDLLNASRPAIIKHHENYIHSKLCLRNCVNVHGKYARAHAILEIVFEFGHVFALNVKVLHEPGFFGDFFVCNSVEPGQPTEKIRVLGQPRASFLLDGVKM